MPRGHEGNILQPNTDAKGPVYTGQYHVIHRLLRCGMILLSHVRKRRSRICTEEEQAARQTQGQSAGRERGKLRAPTQACARKNLKECSARRTANRQKQMMTTLSGTAEVDALSIVHKSCSPACQAKSGHWHGTILETAMRKSMQLGEQCQSRVKGRCKIRAPGTTCTQKSSRTYSARRTAYKSKSYQCNILG